MFIFYKGVFILGSMLNDLTEYREKVKKQLDDLELKINEFFINGDVEKILELSEIMESTVSYYRVIEKEIEKMEKYFEVK